MDRDDKWITMDSSEYTDTIHLVHNFHGNGEKLWKNHVAG